jgi:lipopolysaccharide export system protein LptC
VASAPGLYSRAVAVLKVGLPLVAVGMLSALFLIQTEDTLAPGLRFTEGDLELLGSGLRVTNPTFTGTTDGEDTFRFTAAFVVPDAAPPRRATIVEPRGELALRNGPVVEVTATLGDLDMPRSLLALEGEVRIETSDGYTLTAERVTVDLRAGELEAGDQVVTEGPLGSIDSGTLRIGPAAPGSEEVRRFSFGNGVRVVYDPPPISK